MSISCRKLIPALALILLCLLPARAGATIYTFVDERGVSHFTNVPNDPRYRPMPRSRSWNRPTQHYEQHINKAANRFQLDPMLVKAVIMAESNFDRYAVSSKGAKGLMQLMPGTAQDMRVEDPFDPVANIHGGSRYLRKLLDLFDNDLKLALAAYNAGPETVKRTGGIPYIPETIAYVSKVLTFYKRYRLQDSRGL